MLLPLQVMEKNSTIYRALSEGFVRKYNVAMHTIFMANIE